MSSLYAQSDIEKEVITQFQQDFNAQNYAAIFEKFSPEAKKAIPLNMFEKSLKTYSSNWAKYKVLSIWNPKVKRLQFIRPTLKRPSETQHEFE